MRFYRNTGPRSTPENVTVRKTLLTYNRGVYFSGKVTDQTGAPLWPAMVEKAYATWRRSASLPSMLATPGNYQKLEGGWGDEVFQALYGKAATQQHVQEGESNVSVGFVYPWANFTGYSNSHIRAAFLAGVKRHMPDPDMPTRDLENNPDIGKWAKYLNAHRNDINKELSVQGGTDLHPTVPFVIRHLNNADLRSGDVYKAIVAYCREFMGGEGLQGRYTPAAVNAYNTLKLQTEAGNPVTVGTRAWGTRNKVLTGSGKTKSVSFGGVLTVDDLFPGHAYEVVRAYQDKNNVRYIVLRNPHGNKKVVPGGAEFRIELSRFMRYMDRFDYLDRREENEEN